MPPLEGRAAFVTGAGSGIGRAISETLASRGAFAWVTGFDKAGAEETSEMIANAGGQAAADCCSKAAVRMMTRAVALESAALRNSVRGNSVHFGPVDTPAWRKHGPDELAPLGGDLPRSSVIDPHEVAKTIAPIGVAWSAAEVAETVAFLVLDEPGTSRARKS